MVLNGFAQGANPYRRERTRDRAAVAYVSGASDYGASDVCGFRRSTPL